MWIMMNTGFVSIVQHDEKKDYFVVRARRREHLEEFAPKKAGSIIEMKYDADYRFRIMMTKKATLKIVVQKMMDIDYINFKDSVIDDRLHEAYISVWARMLALQDDPYIEDLLIQEVGSNAK